MALSQEVQEAVDHAADAMARASYVTALGGAGMSVESGIRPFRGPGGLWTEYGEPDFRGYERLLQDPKGWWENRLAGPGIPGMFRSTENAEPNPGHHALVELERIGVLKHLITQNGDNLHRAAGSINVAEIHGNRTLLRCIRCNARFQQHEISLDSLPPHCPRCDGIIKTDIVMFGEPIPPDVLETSQAQALQTDCMLLLGTSGVVYPAAALPGLAQRANGAVLIEVNPYETALSRACDVIVQASAGEALPLLVQRVKELLEVV